MADELRRLPRPLAPDVPRAVKPWTAVEITSSLQHEPLSWFRKRTPEPPPPPPPPAPSPSPQERYAGKPFLKLVDSFVLKCVGALDRPSEAALEQMTPGLRQTFNHAGTWDEIVMHQLGFEPAIRSAIRDLWERNQEIARQNGTTLTPMQFTEMFVAKNVTNA